MSLPDALTERPLEPGDAHAVIALVSACDATYRDFLPAGWAPAEVPPDWPRRFSEPDQWSLGAFDPSGALVAFTSFRPAHERETPGSRTGDPIPGVAHLGTLFVHPSRWREGIAAALLDHAETEMRARGFVRSQLWTPEGAPAERFYTARGWARDGRRDWHPWMGLVVVGYARALA